MQFKTGHNAGLATCAFVNPVGDNAKTGFILAIKDYCSEDFRNARRVKYQQSHQKCRAEALAKARA